MDDLHDLQSASDDFALLGLDRQFNIDPLKLDSAFARISARLGAAADRALAGELLLQLQSARDRLTDPVRRAEELLQLLSSQSDDVTGGGALPAALVSLQQEAAAANSSGDPAVRDAFVRQLQGERRSRLDHIADVFTMPRDIPNRMSQLSRDNGIRSDLRAIRVIDQLLADLA